MGENSVPGRCVRSGHTQHLVVRGFHPPPLTAPWITIRFVFVNELIAGCAALGALLGSAFSVALSLRSTPGRIRRTLDDTLSRIQRLEEDVAGTKAVWTAYREAIDGALDAMNESEERAKTARNKARQHAKRAEQATNGEGASTGDPQLDLIRRARAIGMPV